MKIQSKDCEHKNTVSDPVSTTIANRCIDCSGYILDKPTQAKIEHWKDYEIQNPDGTYTTVEVLLKAQQGNLIERVIELIKDSCLEYFEVLDGRDNTQAEIAAMELSDSIETKISQMGEEIG